MSKSVPKAPASKQIKMQKLERGQKAEHGTDPMNCYNNQYAKTPPPAKTEDILSVFQGRD